MSCGNSNIADLANVITRGIDRVFHADLSVIPEPGSALLSFASLALLLRRRR